MTATRRTRLFPMLAAFLLVAGVVGCKHDKVCDVPIGDATFQCDPNSPLNSGINNCDGYEYFTGGYNGVVVVRISYNEFAAYERTCPYDQERLVMADGYGNIVLECPSCGSRFNTFGQGVPLEGSKTSCYLYQYGTYYDGHTLYVSNY